MSESNWIDVEDELPEPRTRVMVLIPFGMRVQDDSWDGERWLNECGYVSHWQPINAPGSYAEIMQRERGSSSRGRQEGDPVGDHDWYSPAVVEHVKMMEAIRITQLALRLEAQFAKGKTSDE